jgi:hypothetical protein
MKRNHERAAAEGFGTQTSADQSPRGWVKSKLDTAIMHGAVSLDFLQSERHEKQLAWINSRQLSARSKRIQGAMEDCITDMKELLRVLKQDSEVPALDSRLPEVELYTHMPENQRPANHTDAQTYADFAQLLYDMTFHLTNKVLEVDSYTRACVMLLKQSTRLY